VAEPPLSEEVSSADLDAGVRRDLRGLQKDTADTVARHLVAAGSLVDDDPDLALEHARYARQRASRIAVVREAAGIAAYHAGEWNEALGELRAARRMGGGPGHLAVMADIERALGRPERAIELTRGPEAAELNRDETIELAIVAAGARRDLGELDAAVVGLQLPELDPTRRDPWSARLFYAYADNLLAAGRTAEAVQWFVHAADADDDGTTDAASRLAELTGEPVPDDLDDVVFGEEDLPAAGDAEAATGTADAAGSPPDDVAAPSDGTGSAEPVAVAEPSPTATDLDDAPASAADPVSQDTVEPPEPDESRTGPGDPR
jgi:tetratricopeptide (TPR) repeat protein